MQIDLTDVLSERHIPIDTQVPYEAEKILVGGAWFQLGEKSPIHVMISWEKDQVLRIQGQAQVAVRMNCDRCLTEVPVKHELKFDKKVNLADSITQEPYDETNYIDGYMLDADGLLYNELLIDWPMKVLCRPDCKGICSKCGHNLNEGPCSCEHDEHLDPRMSAIRDLFQKSKEV